MGIQTQSWGSTGDRVRKKGLLGMLQAPSVYGAIGIFVVISLFVFEYAVAKGSADGEITESFNSRTSAPLYQSASASAQPVSSSYRAATPATNRSALISQSDLEEQSRHVEKLNQDKMQLDNKWRIERSKHESMKTRIDDTSKSIRLEMDEVLLNASPRERLDELLGYHSDLVQEEKEVAKQLALIEEELASQQLLLVQAQRDLARMEASFAAQKREQDIQRVQEIARHLDREIRFTEMLSFKCSPNKSLAACLNDYPIESISQQWVLDHYQASLAEELTGKVDQIRLSSDWYTAQVSRTFSAANMNLDGSITAEVEVRANVQPRKMMACALLRTSADLCETQSVSLIVRSNKYGDQVYINNKPYGSTPLSLMLDPGLYNVEVRYQGLTQKRTLTLDDSQYINFVF